MHRAVSVGSLRHDVTKMLDRLPDRAKVENVPLSADVLLDLMESLEDDIKRQADAEIEFLEFRSGASPSTPVAGNLYTKKDLDFGDIIICERPFLSAKVSEEGIYDRETQLLNPVAGAIIAAVRSATMRQRNILRQFVCPSEESLKILDPLNGYGNWLAYRKAAAVLEVNESGAKRLARDAMAFQVGSFPVGGSHLGFSTISRIRHSCSNNAAFVYNRDIGIGVLTCSSPIAAGEEITISFLSSGELLQPAASRRTVLRENHFCVCACERCAEERAASATLHVWGERSGEALKCQGCAAEGVLWDPLLHVPGCLFTDSGTQFAEHEPWKRLHAVMHLLRDPSWATTLPSMSDLQRAEEYRKIFERLLCYGPRATDYTSLLVREARLAMDANNAQSAAALKACLADVLALVGDYQTCLKGIDPMLVFVHFSWRIVLLLERLMAHPEAVKVAFASFRWRLRFGHVTPDDAYAVFHYSAGLGPTQKILLRSLHFPTLQPPTFDCFDRGVFRRLGALSLGSG